MTSAETWADRHSRQTPLRLKTYSDSETASPRVCSQKHRQRPPPPPSYFFLPHYTRIQKLEMAQRWESDLEEDLQDVDLNLAIGTYGQNGTYEDGTSHPCERILQGAETYIMCGLISPTADRRGQHTGCAADGSTSCVLSSPRCCQTRKDPVRAHSRCTRLTAFCPNSSSSFTFIKPF